MGKLYQIHVYDATNATRETILSNATAIRFTRELSGSDAIEFDLPRDDPQMSSLALGKFVRVFGRKQEAFLAAGFVAGWHDLSQPFARVRAHGVLSKLASLVFPSGTVLSGTLAANKDRLVQQHDWRRIAAKETTASGSLGDEILSFDGGGSGNQLGTFTNTQSLDRSVAGESHDAAGCVVLTKTGDDYDASGTYETPFIDFGSAPTAFDRLRVEYRQEVDQVKFRVASYDNLTDTRTFSGSPTSDPTTRGKGADITALAAKRFVAIEITLTTYREDETPRLEAVEVVARRSVAGVSAASSFPTVELGDIDVGGLSLLQTIQRICERFDLEWRLTSGGSLEIQARPALGTVGAVWGTDRRATHTLVEGKHANICGYSRDETQLANAVVALADGRLTCVVQDAASQSAHGVRQSVVSFNRAELADLKADADAFLADRKDPRVSLELEAFEAPDGSTPYAPGDLIRVVSRHRKNHEGDDLDVSARIVRETREETEAGERVVLWCDSKPRSFAERALRSAAAQRPSPLHESGIGWSPIIADSDEHTYTIPLPFTPDAVNAEIVQIESAPEGSFAQMSGESSVARVTGRAIGSDSMTFTVKRVSGALDYRVRVQWEAWGRDRRLDN